MTTRRPTFLSAYRKNRPARRVCLAVEALEDRTTPAVMPIVSPGMTSGPGGAATGALHSTAHGSVQGSSVVRGLLRQASQSLTALANSFNSLNLQVAFLASGNFGNPQQLVGNLLPPLEGNLIATTATLNSVASSLSGIPAGGLSTEARAVSSTLRAFAGSLGAVSLAVNDLVGSLPSSVGLSTGPTGTLPTVTGSSTGLPGGSPNATPTSLFSLLTGVARNARALAGSLNGLAATATPTPTQEVNAVLVGVNASLNNLAISLNAFSGTLSGAAAAAPGNGSSLLLVQTGTSSALLTGTNGIGSPLLTGGFQALTSALDTVENSLNALADILPTAAHLPLGTARPLLRQTLTGLAADLALISAQLSPVAGTFSGGLATALGSVFPTVNGSGSLGTASLALGGLYADAAASLGRLASSLGRLGRSLPGLTSAALVRAAASESSLLRIAAADVGLLIRDLTTAQSLLGLTPGIPATTLPANGPQTIDALFAAAAQDLNLVAADLLALMNGT